MDRQLHWDHVYRTREPHQVSWFEPEARVSLELIQHVASDRATPVLDVGGGASLLVDGLLSAGYQHVTVLDISSAALAHAQRRLGMNAASVTWVEGDLLVASLEPAACGLWHDRAVFHFLTDPADRAAYVRQMRHALAPDGHAIIATFADDGPIRCSGLDVVRYSPAELALALGDDFVLEQSRSETHRTPSGATQAFVYCVFRHVSPD